MSTKLKRRLDVVLSVALYWITRFLVVFIPPQKDKFFFVSLNGNNYGDNVKCLSDYILKHYPNSTIVWAFSEIYFNKVNCDTKKVILGTFAYYYHILSSKYIIHNVGFRFEQFRKRKGQIILNTWHGTTLKKLGVDYYKHQSGMMYKLFGYDYIEYNAKMTDLFLSGSRYMSNIFHNALLQEMEVIHEVGTPRNDVFFQDRPDIIKKVREYFSIDDNSFILLYAPTFREDFSIEYYDVDLKRIESIIEIQKARRVSVIVRWHPKFVNLHSKVENILPSELIDATYYPDMQELLYASDMLVTDYSSSMFDFMYSYKPVLLYVPDRELYERGFYYDIDKLPFIVVNKNSEIEEKLNSYDQNEYIERLGAFFEEIGSVECGMATAKAYNLLFSTSENV